jgi:hypothetical protein
LLIKNRYELIKNVERLRNNEGNNIRERVWALQTTS